MEKTSGSDTRDAFERLSPLFAFDALKEPALGQLELRDLRAEKIHRQHRSVTCREAVSLAEQKSPGAPPVAAFTECPSLPVENLRARLRHCAGVDAAADCFETVLLGFRRGPASPAHAHGAALALQLHGAKNWQIWPAMPTDAAPIELRLDAGEALFVPSGWCHATTNETAYTATLSLVLEDA